MLWALLFGLLFASASLSVSPDLSAPDELQRSGRRIVAAIDDPERKSIADGKVKSIVSEAKSFSKRYQRSAKALNKQYRDHAAGYDEAYVVLDELNAEWEAAQQRMLDLQFALREKMTEDEWLAVYGNSSE